MSNYRLSFDTGAGPMRDGVRYTHLPTGITAMSRDSAPRKQKWGWYHKTVRKLLLARVCRPEPDRPPIRRTYDLCPPLGIEPNIRQDGRWLVVGSDAVRRVLGGEIDGMIGVKP